VTAFRRRGRLRRFSDRHAGCHDTAPKMPAFAVISRAVSRRPTGLFPPPSQKRALRQYAVTLYVTAPYLTFPLPSAPRGSLSCLRGVTDACCAVADTPLRHVALVFFCAPGRADRGYALTTRPSVSISLSATHPATSLLSDARERSFLIGMPTAYCHLLRRRQKAAYMFMVCKSYFFV